MKTDVLQSNQTATNRDVLWSIDQRQRPSFMLSDIWRAPWHDLPIRDEILYQYLPLLPHMKLLEIGPGSGFTAFRLARQARHVTLVDVAEASVARLRARMQGLGNLSFLCADVCEPGLVDSAGSDYDAVYGLEVFELLPDPGACLKNLAALLRPGGRLLLQFPNYPKPRSPGVVYFRERATLDQLLQQAGFTSWSVYSLRLRPYADFIFREFHERPLRLFRSLQHRNGTPQPLVYHESWSFQHSERLENRKYLLHCAWSVLFGILRLGGDCFERTLLTSDIRDRNLLLLANR